MSLLRAEPDDAYPETPIASLEAEFTLIGHLFIKSSDLAAVAFLKPEHFFSAELGQALETMRWMHAEGIAITPMSVPTYTENPADDLEKLLLSTLSYGRIVMSYPIGHYAETIAEMAARRMIMKLCEDTIHAVRFSGVPAAEAMSKVTATFGELQSVGSFRKFRTNRQVTARILDRLNNPAHAYSTGIEKLDKAMEGGLFPGMNYLLAGRKKMGKTTLAGTISCNLNDQKVPHLYICAEMSDEEIHQRNLARMTGGYTSSFRNAVGRTEAFQDNIRRVSDASPECTVYLHHPGIPFEDLRSAVAQAISIYKIKGFILDSLQLVGGKNPRKSTAEHQDEVAQWAADYGRHMGIFSIVTAQINQTGTIRGGEGARMACDQGYEIHAPEDDPSRSARWLEMIETRYTPWMNIGDENTPGLLMHEHGQYFHDPKIDGDQAPLPL